MSENPTDCLSMPSASIGPSEARSASDWCPCGSRCDGHAVGPACGHPEGWWGITLCRCGVPLPPGLSDPEARIERPLSDYHESYDEGTVYREETRYSDRSPREGWEAAWRVHRATR